MGGRGLKIVWKLTDQLWIVAAKRGRETLLQQNGRQEVILERCLLASTCALWHAHISPQNK